MRGCGEADRDLEGQKVQTAGVLESSGRPYFLFRLGAGIVRTIAGCVYSGDVLL